MKTKILIIVSIIAALLTGCSGVSVVKEKDKLGRTLKIISFRDGKPENSEEIEYLRNTSKPLLKIFIRQKDKKLD